MGPSDCQRAAPASALLAHARTAADRAGVSRLADITRLDRIGLPVWQAVRPMSRALSVHQGKGPTAADAQLGALLEAVESDAAERFDPPRHRACWRDLPAGQRLEDLADVARDRDAPPDPDTPLDWVLAERVDGRALHLPFLWASLDFTRGLGSAIERASAGLATGSTREDARRAALLELIERDALARFRRSDLEDRLEQEFHAEEVALGWFAELAERLESHGLGLRLFHLPAPSGVPVIAAAIADGAKRARPYAATVGHAAHPDPEQALFQAVAEALQSRLTFIAGARDDCWPWLYTEPLEGIVMAFGPPAPPHIDGTHFAAIDPGPAALAAIVAAVETAHRTSPAFLPIATPEGLYVERAFVEGLGSMERAPPA